MKAQLRFLAMVATLLGVGSLAAADTLRITLKDAVTLALGQHPDLISARARASAADQQHRQAAAAYYPSLTMGFTSNDSYATGPGVFAGSGAGTASTATTRQADVVLSYNLFDSGQRSANEQSTRASSRAANFGAQDAMQTVVSDAANAYYVTLRQEALVAVQKANVVRAQATLDLTHAQVEQGTQAKKDVYQALADLATAKVNLLSAQNGAAIANAQLRQKLGISSDEEVVAADQPTGTSTWAESNLPLTDLVREAFTTRPDVLQAQQAVERDRANVRLARANNGLTVSVDTNLSAVLLQNQTTSRAIGLTASLPVFNGGASHAAIAQARETQKSTEAQLASAKLTARLDVETAYRTLQSARAAVPAALSAQDAAQINYEAASESRKEGIGTVVDVITAQSLLVEAQTNYVQALYTLYIADVTLRRSVGRADTLVGGLR